MIRILREVIAPVLTGYVVVVAMLIAYWRALRRGDRLRPHPVPARWGRLVRDVIVMAIAGYAVFLVLVVVFYFILGGHSATLITDALGYGSLFTFIVVVPVFLVLSWAQSRIRSRTPRGDT
ncbi:MAG: hypothetical protein M3N24_06895 [Actinomycetota bacterium]|nr:hypothetical protein [Actinomycetota bacterium]